jgi:hypothetical protein
MMGGIDQVRRSLVEHEAESRFISKAIDANADELAKQIKAAAADG